MSDKSGWAELEAVFSFLGIVMVTPIMDKDTWARRQHLSRDSLSGDN